MAAANAASCDATIAALEMKPANHITRQNGDIGELQVQLKMLQPGHMVTKCDGGNALIDLVALGRKLVGIQAKTAEGVSRAKPFWIADAPADCEWLWHVLVNLTAEGPDFYVFHSSVIAKRVAEWLVTPKRDGSSHSQGVTKFYPTAEELAEAKDSFAKMFT
jgi:hypothetical protein